MTGITEEYRAVVIHLLKYLPDEEILSLATTISRGMIVISNVEEAKNAIMSFSETIESILRRKKLKQEYLVRFMWDCQIEMADGIEKHLLIRQFVEHLPRIVSICNSRAIEGGPSRVADRTRRSENDHPPGLGQVQVGEPLEYSAAFVDQFVPWYINTFNNGPPGFGPQHFWDDVELRVTVRQSNDSSSATCTALNGAQSVADHLLFLHQKGLRMLATPQHNSSGTCASFDNFGRVTVTFRGCIHHAITNGPAGLFQQSMGLIQDIPQQPNGSGQLFKIKFLCLEVESHVQPQLIAGDGV